MEHRHGGQAGADQGGEWHADGLGAEQLIEPLPGLLEAGQGRRVGIAATQHGEQVVEGQMKFGQLLAKAAAPAQGDKFGERDLAEVSGYLQRDLEMEAILTAAIVVAGFEQMEQAIQIVVIGNERPVIGECPLTGETHGDQIGKAPCHSDPPLIPAGKTMAEAKAVQPLQPRLIRAEAVVVGLLTPATNQLPVAKHFVAHEVGGYKAADLVFQLWGNGGKEVGLRALGQQVGLLLQGIDQSGEAALFADGEDEGEPLQIEQGKFEPELVAYLHAGVVDIGLHRIGLSPEVLPGAGSGIYARLTLHGKHCVGECEQMLIQ